MLKRGLSNGNHNSGMYVIKPLMFDINGTSRSDKIIYKLNQEGYISFE